MKLLSSLLIIASLIIAVLGAVTAYMPRLSLPDEELIGLTLGSDAGKDPATGKPLLQAKTVLTADHLAALRAAGVPRVRVLEFSFARWSGRWLFLAGAAGLLVGGLLARQKPAAQAGQLQSTLDSSRQSLAHIRSTIRELRALLPATPDDQRPALIVSRLDPVQRDLVPAFLSGRPVLISSLGLSGFAQTMERFSVGERSINRAWSAAADGFTDEVDELLSAADTALAEAESRLM